MIKYWPEGLPQSPETGMDMSPVGVLAEFAPDVGASIARPRTTGAPMIAEMSWVFEDGQIADFSEWFKSLGQGAQKFAMRDVPMDAVRLWRFMSPYRMRFLLKGRARVSARVMMLPGEPWFAPYNREGLSSVPSFVADYENGIYGIDGVKGVASDMPNIAGTFLVRRTKTWQVTFGQETLTAGDITQAQPPLTLRIEGFPV